MKQIVLFRLLCLAFLSLTSLTIKSERTFCSKKCCKIAMSQVIVEPKVEFASVEGGPLPPDDGYMIKI